MLLKFQDEKDCLEFSDAFVALNPPTENAAEAEKETALASRSEGTAQDSQDALSFVGRLLHDEDFASFVDNLESCINSSEDGARMFEALVNKSDETANKSENSPE